jgi:hypothetical protein
LTPIAVVPLAAFSVVQSMATAAVPLFLLLRGRRAVMDSSLKSKGYERSQIA